MRHFPRQAIQSSVLETKGAVTEEPVLRLPNYTVPLLLFFTSLLSISKVEKQQGRKQELLTNPKASEVTPPTNQLRRLCFGEKKGRGEMRFINKGIRKHEG